MMIQEQRENDERNAELIEAQSEMQLNNKIVNAETIGQDAVKKLQ